MYDGQINWGVSSLLQAAENNANARRKRRNAEKPADELAIEINQNVDFARGTSFFFANNGFHDHLETMIGETLKSYTFEISFNDSAIFDIYEPNGGKDSLI